MPALFQALELSSATSPSRSKIVMLHDGSSFWSSDPRVALMMPPPIKATSMGALTI